MLAFLEKLTRTPEQVGPDDIIPVHEAGISDQAVEDALYISAFFQIINRLADAFDVSIPSEEVFAHSADRLLAYGYL
jgi:alkylhydroperoxidase family enzyme